MAFQAIVKSQVKFSINYHFHLLYFNFIWFVSSFSHAHLLQQFLFYIIPASLSLISYCCSIILPTATTPESHLLSLVAQHPQLDRSESNGAPSCPFQLANFGQLQCDLSCRRPPPRDHELWSTTLVVGQPIMARNGAPSARSVLTVWPSIVATTFGQWLSWPSYHREASTQATCRSLQNSIPTTVAPETNCRNF